MLIEVPGVMRDVGCIRFVMNIRIKNIFMRDKNDFPSGTVGTLKGRLYDCLN